MGNRHGCSFTSNIPTLTRMLVSGFEATTPFPDEYVGAWLELAHSRVLTTAATLFRYNVWAMPFPPVLLQQDVDHRCFVAYLLVTATPVRLWLPLLLLSCSRSSSEQKSFSKFWASMLGGPPSIIFRILGERPTLRRLESVRTRESST